MRRYIMGLDITFYSTEKRKKNPIKKEIGFFRKANFLIPFFLRDYEGGLEIREIRCPRRIIKDLHKRCKTVLENRRSMINSKILPTYSVLFGGSTEYDDIYYSKVNDVKEWSKYLLKHWKEMDLTVEFLS